MRACFATVGVVLFLLTAIVGAQTGQIGGVVRDASGAVLPGVTVEASSPVLVEKVRSVVTDESGRYQISALPAGVYTLTFIRSGFTPLKRETIEVTTSNAVVDVDLQVGAFKETLIVRGEAPSIFDTSSALMQVSGDAGPGDFLPVPDGSAAIDLIPRSPAAARNRPPDAPFVLSGSLGVSQLGGIRVYDRTRYPRSPRTPGTESYARAAENAFQPVSHAPLSTFSIDVDTASYANARRFLTDSELPPPDAVRVEEMINYFHYDYPEPRGDAPFSVTTEVVRSPWNPAYRLALIGLRGRRHEPDAVRTPRNLVFLIDVSGSMQTPDKLALVQNGMGMLVDTLQPFDRVAIVVYAGDSGLVLPSTPGSEKRVMHEAIERLEAGGSTNGAEGIRLAYEVARRQFVRGGVNRVILATDGDFNVGVTDEDELVALIEAERASGVFLSVLGVGRGNLKDSTMELLADKGNGNYAYLDSIQEARRVLVREAGGTLETIAKDVKIQVEFNPANVAGYRLVGYENRLLRPEDFNDDRKDAGEIGAGHTVTALYEIVPAGVDMPAGVDALKYQQPSPQPRRGASSRFGNELMTVKLRYKDPDGDSSRLMAVVVRNRPQTMTANVGFASAVAEFGMLLRGSAYADRASFDALAERAQRFRGADPDGYRAEFIKLSELARSLR